MFSLLRCPSTLGCIVRLHRFLCKDRFQLPVATITFGFSTVVHGTPGTWVVSASPSATRKDQNKLEKTPIVSFPNNKFFWNDSLDKVIIEYRENNLLMKWKEVAKCVGHGVTPDMCKNRWNATLKFDFLPGSAGGRKGKWTDGEMELLRDLVGAQGGTELIDWSPITKTLHRSPVQCQGKWKALQYALQGRFTPEKDALILETAKDWETGQRKDKGLWTSLGEKMQRNDSSIRQRYRLLKAPQPLGVEKKIVKEWSADMDAALAEARRSAQKATWAGIAAMLNKQGHDVSLEHCRDRWNSYLKNILAGQRNKVDWSPEELALLLKLRNEQLLNWKEIGRILKVFPAKCNERYKSLCAQHLKRGLYTAEEDECILRAAKEWGDPRLRHGLWPELERKMQRPASNLRQRWLHLITSRQEL